MTIPEGWTYVEEFGSVYKVEGGHLFYAPMLIGGFPDMTSKAEVELENIEPEVAKVLIEKFAIKR